MALPDGKTSDDCELIGYYCENSHTTKSNVEIQFTTYQKSQHNSQKLKAKWS